ncbi:hypothetical protein AMATHDRAFT_54859 [Amanita thiersii Skay4041]|uniref:GPI anchored protein n=1 Tax=Amanita thiersii Skay4041 TaxID=703135 RepID=A0A2A9NZR0_9AGAR|nr:hypothetical protein AMATHDRAFT_54859 [Amanita thiersii Skay4041]
MVHTLPILASLLALTHAVLGGSHDVISGEGDDATASLRLHKTHVIRALLRTPDLESRSFSSSGMLNVRQTGSGTCDSGYLPCKNGVGCCEVGTYCGTFDGQPGCCPNGRTCSGPPPGPCTFADEEPCPGQDFCCPTGYTCGNNQRCFPPGSSGSGSSSGTGTGSNSGSGSSGGFTSSPVLNTPTGTATFGSSQSTGFGSSGNGNNSGNTGSGTGSGTGSNSGSGSSSNGDGGLIGNPVRNGSVVLRSVGMSGLGIVIIAVSLLL